MSAASNTLENELLDHVLGGGGARAYSAPSTVYVALFANSTGTAATDALESGTNSTSGVGNWGYYEVSNGAYQRQSVTFADAGAVTDGTISSNATVSFPVATADYETNGSTGNVVTHLAIMDSQTAGSVLFYGALSVSKTVSAGDQFTISSGNLSISLA